MSSKKQTVGIAVVIALTILTGFANIPLGAATNPSNMLLVYDFGSQVLSVNVSHSVANTKTHHIETIEIQKNGVSLLNRSYENQSFSWGMNDTFSVSTVVGDNLTVTGFCSRGDFLTTWLIVTSTTATNSPPTNTTSTTETTSTDSLGTLAGAAPAIAAVVIVIIFFVLFFMWLRPEYAPDALKQLGSRIRTGVAGFWEKP